MSALGELETLILLAILRLGGETYGVPIRDEIEARTGRSVARGAVYTGLARLEKKGYLESFFGPPTPTRGGKSKRFYSVSDEGRRALRVSMRAVDRMRSGIEGFPAES
jgi:DNA-binding PadR family transcriptional regulator